MAKSLAELRQSPHVGAVEQVYPICVAGKLVAEYDVAKAKVEEAAAKSTKETGPRRIGAKSELRERIEEAEAIRNKMNDHLVPVKFRADLHKWRDWVAANPPREDNPVDAKFLLNFDALVEAAGVWVVEINEDEPQPGDWEFVYENAAMGDRRNAATVVYNLHQMTVNVPKSLSHLLEPPERSDDSE